MNLSHTFVFYLSPTRISPGEASFYFFAEKEQKIDIV